MSNTLLNVHTYGCYVHTLRLASESTAPKPTASAAFNPVDGPQLSAEKQRDPNEVASDVQSPPKGKPTGAYSSSPSIHVFHYLQDSDESDFSVTILDDAPGESKFREIIQTIADYSSVDALPALVFATNRVVRLPSEKATDRQQSLTLSTSPALVDMVNVWYEEFAKRDHLREAQRTVPFHTMFKARENRPSLKLFKSADPWLPFEVAKNPPNTFPWLPLPNDRFKIRECDVWHLETQSRITLRAVNFVEADLQAISNPSIPGALRELLMAQLPLVVRMIAQVQSAVLAQIVQLRRDRYLALVQRIAPEDVSRLRHAPLNAENDLFPGDLLREINAFTKDFLHDSAMLNMAKLSTSQPSGGQHGRSSSRKHGATKKRQQPANDGWRRFDDDHKHPSLPSVVPTPHTPAFAPTATLRTVSPTRSVGSNDDWRIVFLSELKRLEALRVLQDSVPVGGRLRMFWQEWQLIGASRKVVRWFRKGYPLPFSPDGRELALRHVSTHSPAHLMVDYSSDPVRHEALHGKVEELLAKSAIEPLPVGQLAFFNRVFLVPKKTGGFRLILDVSKLNEWLQVDKFHMDTVQVIRAAVEEGMWAVSIDLSDAYHHIPIRTSDTCFLAFQVGSRCFRYVALPFGLSPAPQVFTAALTALKMYARKTWEIPVFQYLDDWLLLSRSERRLAEASCRFVEVCLRLGLLVNLSKSQLVPTQRIEHLGVDWDLQSATVRPPTLRVESLVATLLTIRRTMRAPLPLLESVRGQMVAMEKLVRHGRINFRVFQAAVTRALQSGRNNRWVKLPLTCRPNLSWWAVPTRLLQGVPSTPPKPTVTVATDASTEGWGATWNDKTLKGKWSRSFSSLHINALELTAVLLALKEWGHLWVNHAVMFLMDNRTAVSYVSKQGGTRSSCSTRIAESIFARADECQLSISAAYLPGERNVIADMLSRQGQVLKTEWHLNQEMFQWICSRSPFGTPTIDLFANKFNKQLARYMSPCPDTLAVAVDALTSDWPDEVLYAFPPWAILDRFVIKCHQEQPLRLILVAPLLTSAAWYPPLRSHARWVQPLQPSQIVLSQPHWNHVHPEPERLFLGAWFIQWRA